MEGRYTQPGESRLLAEILKEQKRMTRSSRLRAVLALILVLALLAALVLLLPRVLGLLDRADAALRQVEEKLPELEGLVSDAKGMLEKNAEAMGKINSVDFDKLNQAINDLAAAVKPLGDVGRFFTGGGGN